MSALKPILSILILAVSLAACWGVTESEPSAAPETLSEARALWDSQELDDYRFEYERVCFCAPTQLSATVYVRADTIFRFDNLRGNGEPVGADTLSIDRTYFVTVDELFDRIGEGASQEQLEELLYDPELGYPRKADIGEFAVDAGVSHVLRDLEPVAY